MEKLVEQLGVAQLSKSQVSEMATHLDAQVEAFRNRPLDAGPYTFVWCDALTIKVREAGRTVNVHALVAVGVNADGQREVLGLDVASAEDGAGWLAFLRSLTARGLSGVRLVVSDAHRGLVDAIGATLPGAAWQRCRTHYLRNLLTRVAKLLGETHDIRHFPTAASFAAHAGVAPVPASSGNTSRHRLARGGNRQLNRALFTIAMVQARWHPDARDYLARKRSEGKSSAEARRCLKRHLAAVVYRAMKRDINPYGEPAPTRT